MLKTICLVLLILSTQSLCSAEPLCEDRFLQLFKIREQSLESAVEGCGDARSSVAKCYQVDEDFLKRTSALPTNCNDPLASTWKDLREKLKNFAILYRDETQRELPDSLFKASIVVRDFTHTTIRANCDQKAQYWKP